MLLKRHYRFPEGWKADRNLRGENGKLKDPSRPEGELLNQPPIDHVEIKHTGISAEQNFSTRFVEAGLAQGFASVGDGKITLRAKPEDLVYTIKRGPGHYCCHCGVALPDASRIVSPGITAGMQQVAAMHEGKPSPDAGNPSGYLRLNEYQCVLDFATHEKWKAKSIGEARREAAQYFRERQKKGGPAATKAGV